MTFTRDYLIDLLSKNDCEVEFTKVDGTARRMPCTLRADKLPAITESKESTRKENLDNISVWCLDKSSWRSFKIANVKSISVIE